MPQTKTNRPFQTVLLVIGGWLLFLIVDILKKDLLSRSMDFFLYYALPSIAIWILLTFPMLVVFRVSRKFSIASRLLLLLLLGVAASIVKTLGAWSIFYAITSAHLNYAEFLGNIVGFYYIESSIIAWILMIVFFVGELYGRYRDKSLEAAQLEAQLSQAQLQNLKMQLQPHFLFNAHNTVAMLIRTGKYDQAIAMISGLSEMLRSSLTEDRPHLVSLQQELDFLDKYLAIEQIRFEDRLTISYDIDKSLLDKAVPNLLLQPIVENAFKHGISESLLQSYLKISAEKNGARMKLSVYNTGPSLNDDSRNGIGLSNAQQRLQQLYNDDYKFSLQDFEDGVLAEIELPQTQVTKPNHADTDS